MPEEKWSKEVGLHEGALEKHGWKEHESAEERHRALERSVRADGYRTTVDRLDFMANVASRHDNHELHATARADLEWLHHWEEEKGDSDRRHEEGTEHRVRGHEREVDGHTERVRPHLAKNPRRRA